MAATVQFYHLLSTPLERALPKLLEKAYEAGYRAHVLLDSPERVKTVDDVLWTYSQAAFLPHGSAQTSQPERQPIYLAADLAIRNNPDILCITEGTQIPEPDQYKRILDMFDGNDQDATARARIRWKQYKDQGCDVAYFRQTEAGGWEKAQG